MQSSATTNIQWAEKDGTLTPIIEGLRETPVWTAQPGSQQAFLECPVFEVLYEGARGPGKTDALIMDFAQYVGRGFGAVWRGILFRRHHEELKDIIAKTKKWFPRIFPAATFVSSPSPTWKWPSGEELLLRALEKDGDADKFQGHEYPWVGWEELTKWPTDVAYKLLQACCRSPHVNVPSHYRATTNPYGVGHNWVKARFGLPVPDGQCIGRVVQEMDEEPRVAVHGVLDENKILLYGEPGYRKRIAGAARNAAERAAWMEGDWNIIAGGMFDDLWRPRWHVIPNIPPVSIPKEWRIDRSYDHGQSAPFSVGWWAESNGEPLELQSGRLIGPIRGDLIRFAEWYGWTGRPNEGLRMLTTDIADGIIERQTDQGVGGRVKPGPADGSIFDPWEPGRSIAGDMKSRGVRWKAADKSRGSRVHGWEQMRRLLADARPSRDGVRERPGMFVCERCVQFIRMIPAMPRDDKNLDDIDTESEDHLADEVRYRARNKVRIMRSRSF